MREAFNAAVSDPRLTLTPEQASELAKTMTVSPMNMGIALAPICRKAVNALIKLKPARGENYFKYRITRKWAEQFAPDYFDRIAQPMDLKLMLKRTKGTTSAELYTDLGQFEADMRLIAANAMAYNGDTHPVAHAAADLLQQFYATVWPGMVAEAEAARSKEQLRELQSTISKIRAQRFRELQAASK